MSTKNVTISRDDPGGPGPRELSFQELQLLVFRAGDWLRDLHGALPILAGTLQDVTSQEHDPILSTGD